ncbi:MAG: response regulator transcription factor [Crocinitomix sp.]|nr:response regulator transcription factor [Crocinitomix sp.]
MIRIVIVDFQKMFRVSLKSFLSTLPNCEVCLDVSSTKEITKDFNFNAVHLVVFDPADTDPADFEKLQQNFESSKFMILTNYVTRDIVTNFMHQGVSGFFSKDDCPTQLESAIYEIVDSYNLSEVVLGKFVRQVLFDNPKTIAAKNVKFTSREIEVLNLVCLEKTNSEISEILGLSIRTIETHRRRMIDKADCRTIIGVIMNALGFSPTEEKMQNKNASRAS